MSGLDYRGFYLKDSSLADFGTLEDEDLNSNNLLSGTRPYINNFIFIPKERNGKLANVQSFLARAGF